MILEQKSFLIILPILVIVFLLIHPIIQMWINKNTNIISITTLFILSAHLISSTSIPNYQFLISKDLAGKTIILQLTNVLTNTLLFLFFVTELGYYSIIISNVVAILSSFALSLYYQKKYLNSLIFESRSQFIKYLTVFIIILMAGIFIKNFIEGEIAKLIILPITTVILSVFFYKVFKLVTKKDVERYFGKKTNVAHLLFRIYNY